MPLRPETLLARGAGIVVSLVMIASALFLGARFLRQSNDNPLSQDVVLTADVARMAAAVPGRIATVAVKENDAVTRGDLLFALDPTTYRLQVEQAKADLAIAEAALEDRQRAVSAERSNAVVAREQVTRARTNLALATRTLARLQSLRPNGYVSAQQVDDAATAERDAEVSLRQAELQQDAADTLVSTMRAATALVAARRAALATAEQALADTEVHAPFNGRVAGLAALPGSFVLTGQSVFTLIDTGVWYASAAFLETDLPAIAAGDCVTVFALADRSVAIAGRVEGTGWGVGQEDVLNLPHLLPIVPKNLDWVRIQQRFPVRIRLLDPPENLMRIGASATATVHHGTRC